jgi:GTP-binding protein Era
MEEFKSGFVAVVGKTNVGKSTIINRLVGEKVSAVVNKVQTTRKNIRAIVNTDNAQIIFIDTPGFYKSKTKLSKEMNETAFYSIKDADSVLYVIDAKDSGIDEKAIEQIKNANKKTILIINKIDLVSPKKVADIINEYKDLYDFSAIIPVSVRKNENVDVILDEIIKTLKPGAAYYDVDEYTDQTMRELAEETIREKAMKLLQEEVPHGIYVEVTKMKFRKTKNKENIYDVDATIYCLKNSHKGIIIGKGGQMLKRIGTYAREDMEKMFQTKVNLTLLVKVREDWINNEQIVKNIVGTKKK